MSFVSVVPETVAVGTTELTGIGSAINAANAVAAAPIAGLLAAGADEISTALATLFAEYGQQYQALAGQVAVSYDQFTRKVMASVNAYAAVETANIGQLVSSAGDLINEPFVRYAGRPLIGDGADGYTNAYGVGTDGRPGGWLYGDGGTGGISTRIGVAGGAGGAAGLIGDGGAGGKSVYGGAPGGRGGPAILIGDGGTGGASGPGGVGGLGGRAGLLWGNTGTAGLSTLLLPNQTLLYIDQYGNPLINISVAGGPSLPVIVDSGSTGLLVPPQYVNLAALGAPTGSGSVSYGITSNRLFIDYDMYQTTVNYGNGIVSPSTTVAVATSAFLNTPSNPIDLSLLPAYLGVGPNNGFPFSTPTNASLPTNMNQGVLFNMPRGLLEFGPNSLPPIVDLDGAPGTVVQVQINNELPQTVTAYIDSGGVGGTIPQSLVPGLAVGNRLPEGTIIRVSTINGVHLYTQTVTAASTPVVVPSNSLFNTGNYPFLVGPIYVWNNDVIGTTVFNRLI